MTETRQEAVREPIPARGFEGAESPVASEDSNLAFAQRLRGIMPDLIRLSRARERRVAMYENAIDGSSGIPKTKARRKA